MLATNEDRWRLATQYLLGAIVVFLCHWDMLATRYGGNQASISVVMTAAVKRYPIIGVLIGICLGHWFYSQTL